MIVSERRFPKGSVSLPHRSAHGDRVGAGRRSYAAGAKWTSVNDLGIRPALTEPEEARHFIDLDIQIPVTIPLECRMNFKPFLLQ